MTDAIVYVGSANYSEESADNTEFGFVSTDRDFINYIKSEVLSDVQSSAIPYYEYDYTALLLEANVALSAVYNARNELYEEVYRQHDDVDGEWYYYVEHEATLTVGSLDRLLEITSESCNIASDIYDAIDTITLSGYIYYTDTVGETEGNININNVAMTSKPVSVSAFEFVEDAYQEILKASEAGLIKIRRYEDMSDKMLSWIETTIKNEYKEAKNEPDYRCFLKAKFNFLNCDL